MTKIDPKEVQRLRSESGAGVMDCKRALEETGGDYTKALALIKERGIQSVAKKSEREAKEGLVASYIHSGGRIGALVELAGEAFLGERKFGISPQYVKYLAEEIRKVQGLPAEVAIVIGGGNFMRGAAVAEHGIDRATADYMGMLAMVINALALQSALEQLDVPTRVQSAITIQDVAEPYIRRKAIRHLEKGRVVIFAAGTGNPYFTSDTAATLRAAEIGADVILMGKNQVDGVYDADPRTTKDAKKIDQLTHRDLLDKRLGVMDATAAALAEDRDIPIIIFDISQKDAMVRAAKGEHVGTLVHS